MEYYFEVSFQCCRETMLIKAKDVIEAGNKAVKRFSEENEWCPNPTELLVEINRTKIRQVIE